LVFDLSEGMITRFLLIEDLSSFIRGVHKGRTAVPHLRTLVPRPPNTASRKAMAG